MWKVKMKLFSRIIQMVTNIHQHMLAVTQQISRIKKKGTVVQQLRIGHLLIEDLLPG